MDNEQLLQAISEILDKKLNERLSPINNRLDGIDNRLDAMDNRFEKLESQISALKVGQSNLRRDIKKIDETVTATHELALDAWAQSTENRTWLGNGKLPIIVE